MNCEFFKKGIVGFSYGVSFPLTIVILDYWLKDCGVSNTAIGFFSLFHLPFALKILFAPIIDNCRIPYLSNIFGKQRSWVIFSQIMLMISILCMANTNPKTNISLIMIFASLTAVFDGFKNIALYPYQISDIEHEKFGYVAAIVNFGHRIGTIAIKCLVLYISHFFNWKVAYESAAFVTFICMLMIAFMEEPDAAKEDRKTFAPISHNINIIYVLKDMLKSFGNAKFALVMLFKASDFFVQKMSRSFCIELGFSKLEIANVVQFFGSISVIIGSIFIGYFIERHKLIKVMFFTLLMHMIFLFSYLLLCAYGNDITILRCVVFLEGISGGAISTAFIAFLYMLCKTGSQYAIFWAVHELGGMILRLLSGICVDSFGWPIFFTITPILSFPALAILWNIKLDAK